MDNDVSSETNRTGSLQAQVSNLQNEVNELSAGALQETVAKLQEQVQRISQRIKDAVQAADQQLQAHHVSTVSPAVAAREKVDKISSEVVSSNPYSRLMALEKMGVVKNYEQIRQKCVAIVGVGGVGSVAAEMLTRCGVGRLLLYDYDTVELANMNRLFFRPDHVGLQKTQAAALTLGQINPDVAIEPYHMNITTVEGFDKFKASLCDEAGASRVDLVLSCVDNYEARITINQICLELNQVWMESGVSEDAVSGHIQVLVPGATACFQCVPPLVVASGIDERTLKREGVCAASLPTTMGIVAGMLVQNSLKYMLAFGRVTQYLGYNSLQDFFPTYPIKANLQCCNPLCCELQRAVAAAEKPLLFATSAVEAPDADAPAVHDANDWGIEIVRDDESAASTRRGTQQDSEHQLPEGLKFELPSAGVDADELRSAAVVDTGESLSDLMQQLKAL